MHEESQDMFFHVSKLEGLVKGFVCKGDLEKSMNILEKRMNNLRGDLEKGREGIVKTLDLINLEERIEEIVGHMNDDMMEGIVKLLQNLEDHIPKIDDVGQGTPEDNDSVPMGQPSINKNDLRGFDSIMGSNQGWSTMGIQLAKIDMRKFNGKDPITWIFQMEQLFDIQ